MSVEDILRKYEQPTVQPDPVGDVISKYEEPVNPLVQQEPQYAWNPDAPISYEGEGALPLAFAGFGQGGANVYRNIANMLGFESAPTIFAGEGEYGLGLGMTDTSDEALREGDEDWEGITDTTAGAVGEFAGEIAALAPLGGIGSVARGTQIATKLPTATRILAAAAEGAAGGSILAGPDERMGGALLGAAAGGTLAGTGAALSRTFGKGLAKMKEPVDEAVEYVTRKTGKRPDIPLIVGADPLEGSISATTRSLADTMSLIPAARGAVDRQIRNLSTDLFEADLRHALPKRKADIAAKVLRETGDMQKAVEAAGASGAKKRVLDEAVRKAPGGRYTGKQLLDAAEDLAGDGPLTNAPFRDIALNRIEVLPRGDATMAGASTVASRDTLRQLTGAIMRLTPGLGKTLGTKSFQNFVLGNAAWQRALKRAVDTGSGQAVRRVMGDIRRAMSAQLGGSSEAQAEAEAQVQALRGQ